MPLPRRYSHSSGRAVTRAGAPPPRTTVPAPACRVLAASSLAIMTPLQISSSLIPTSAAASPYSRRAALAQVASAGNDQAQHVPVRRLRKPPIPAFSQDRHPGVTPAAGVRGGGPLS